MKVLVTGISGFIGSHLAAHLVACGDEVTGTYTGHCHPLPGVTLHAVEINDRAGMTDLVAAADPDAVIHLAGLSHVGGSWERPADYFRVNVLGTESLLAAAAGRRVVIASSAEVYGAVPKDRQPIREEEPLAPASPYAMTKACAERLAVGGGAVLARTFNLLGPGQSPRFAFPSFAAQLAAIARQERPPVLKVGNLESQRDFVHVADGARAYRWLAEHGEPAGAYNVASGMPRRIADLLTALIAISGCEVRVETDSVNLRPVDLPVLAGHPGRLQALGWQPELTVEDALSDLWRAASGAPVA